MSSDLIWCVDTSVLLRALTDSSAAAVNWLTTADGILAGSKMLEIETCRIIINRGGDSSLADDYLSDFTFTEITNEIADKAATLPVVISGADAIHVATALQLGQGVTLVTHDKQQAAAATVLGLSVFDPVTDDPGHPPVA